MTSSENARRIYAKASCEVMRLINETSNDDEGKRNSHTIHYATSSSDNHRGGDPAEKTLLSFLLRIKKNERKKEIDALTFVIVGIR